MNSKTFARMSVMFTLPVVLGVGGCDAPAEGPEPLEVAGFSLVSPEQVLADEVLVLDPEDRPLVAVLDGATPGMVEFLDVSETDVPEILVVAVGEEGARVTSLIDADTASPLEVYLAFAPTTDDPPAALFQDHARLSGEGIVATSPREFKLFRDTETGSACVAGASPGNDWTDYWAAWRSGFGSVSSSMEYGAGNPGLASGTAIQVSNTTRRALDACAIHSSSTLFNVKLQLYTAGIGWSQLGSWTAPGMFTGWGVATRSISSAGSTATQRFVMTSIDGNNLIRLYWGGAYST